MTLKLNKNNIIWYTALVLWAVFSIITLLKAATTDTRSLCPLYFDVGRAWWEGRGIYTGTCYGFMYWSGFAVLISFFAHLPYTLGSFLWSVLSLGSIIFALYKLGKKIFPQNLNYRGAILLLSFPLGFEGLFNQQSNAFITALAITGSVYIFEKRLWLGSFLLLFAGITKIAPLSFALLILVVYPRKLWWRYLITCIVIIIIPFIFQDYNYVYKQYQIWVTTLSSEGDLRWMYRDAWTLYELISQGEVNTHEFITGMTWYRIAQLLAAGWVCLLCMYIKYIKKYSATSLLIITTCSGSIWWLLFGPSTEIATCISGAAAATLTTLLAHKANCGKWLMYIAYPCIALGSTGDFEYNIHLFLNSDWGKGVLPIGGILLYSWLSLFAVKALALTIETKKI